MGYTDVDNLAINTIRVLAVSYCPSQQKKGTPPPPNGASRYPTIE
jgi:hypothetical protein